MRFSPLINAFAFSLKEGSRGHSQVLSGLRGWTPFWYWCRTLAETSAGSVSLLSKQESEAQGLKGLRYESHHSGGKFTKHSEGAIDLSFFATVSCKSYQKKLKIACLLDGFSERRKEVKVTRKFQSYILVGIFFPWLYCDELIDFWTITITYMLGESRNCKRIKTGVSIKCEYMKCIYYYHCSHSFYQSASIKKNPIHCPRPPWQAQRR